MFTTCRTCESRAGQLSFAKSLETHKKRWISLAGNPNTVQCDRGLHNRGVLAQYMSAHGIEVDHAPLETPEAAIGRVERHGGVLKGMARKVLAQTKAKGEAEIQSVLDESCLTTNNLFRHGGYFPSQRVLCKAPREPPSQVSEDQFADLGAIEDQVDPESRSAFQHQARLEAKKAFIYVSTQVRGCNALYSEVPSLSLERTLQETLSAARVVGHEGNENQNVWILCENVPVQVSAQNIRPAGDAEALTRASLQKP